MVILKTNLFGDNGFLFRCRYCHQTQAEIAQSSQHALGGFTQCHTQVLLAAQVCGYVFRRGAAADVPQLVLGALQQRQDLVLLLLVRQPDLLSG